MPSRVRVETGPKWIRGSRHAAADVYAEVDDASFQQQMLEGVSRTFALTIPQLPRPLCFVVSNAYLLCRVLDTIEDEPGIAAAEKGRFFNEFQRQALFGEDAERFSSELSQRLTEQTIPAERELIQQVPRVVRITRSLSDPERQALSRCVQIMARGMDHFQRKHEADGFAIQSLKEMDHYCYFVAGVVGEMLTELFCGYSPQIARRRREMMRLAPSFGQGLQMTNILKDIREDQKRSASWLPRDIFGDGVQRTDSDSRARFEAGVERLTAVAHGHLRRALDYTLCIPKHETGLRKFCLWATGMALLTLRKIQKNPIFSNGTEVKISRRSVKTTVTISNLLVSRDALLRGTFRLVARPLPFAPPRLSVKPRGNPQAESARELDPGKIDDGIRRAAAALRQRQRADGHWCFNFEADCTITAEYILMMHFSGEVDEAVQEKMARYLRRLQGEDGGWPLYYGGAAEISCSVKSYYALKLAGDDPGAAHMRKARAKILLMGGAAKANVFTRITLALFGQVPWRAVPFMPVELLLLPRWFPFHLSKVAYWSRTVMVPLLVLYSRRAQAKNPTGKGVIELFVKPPHQERDYFVTRSTMGEVFLRLERAVRLIEPLIPSALRRHATNRAVSWFTERLNSTHGLGAIFPAMVNAYEAYVTLGFPANDPRRRQAKVALERLVVEQGEEAFCQPCVSPVWDTVLAAIALRETGEEGNAEAADRGLAWLKERQLLDAYGDWSERRPNLPGGGWPFQYENSHYPDLDDTAFVAFAMHETGDPQYKEAVKRAADWLVGMQSRGGGLASFELDNTHFYLNEIPFADHGALLDPPTADVSARCAMLFGCLAGESSSYREALVNAVDFLCREQEEDGAWFGRWGTNYIYGTWSVLLAFEQMNEKPGYAIERAVEWLKETQRDDGGWGESNDSYHEPDLRGQGSRSTAFQTAWAILGLIAAGEASSEAARRGVEYLLKSQGADGSWHDPEFTCPGFPRVFYLKYHGYDDYFPLWALARYRRSEIACKGTTDARR